MNVLAKQATEQVEKLDLVALVHKAAASLASAETSAEVLQAKESASFAYDIAKRQARIAKAKHAHDEIIRAVNQAQNDALLIEAQAKVRLADEYDAAQERGEVATLGSNQHLEGVVSVNTLGLRRDQIHEARKIRDAVTSEPDILDRVIEKANEEGRAITKADIRRSVAEAAANPRLVNISQKREKNPNYKPNPDADRVSHFSSLCRSIGEIENIDQIAKWNGIPVMADRVPNEAKAALEKIQTYLEARNA